MNILKKKKSLKPLLSIIQLTLNILSNLMKKPMGLYEHHLDKASQPNILTHIFVELANQS